MFDFDIYQIAARLFVLFMVLPVHEFAHAWAATSLGDDTPERQGRLTLNPFAHLNLYGSIALLFFGFGWGNPVRVDPQNLKNPKRDMALVALAGPAANVLVSLLTLIVIKLVWAFVEAPRYYAALNSVLTMLLLVITINLTLAVFNLLPVPPLDGSKVLGALLPPQIYYGMAKYEGLITVVLLVLLYTGMLDIPVMWASGKLLTFLDFITRPIEWLAR